MRACWCGHARDWHLHHRAGTDCSGCFCAAYSWRWWPWNWLAWAVRW